MGLIADWASIVDLLVGLSKTAFYVSLTLLILKASKYITVTMPVAFGKHKRNLGSLVFHQLLKLRNLLGVHQRD